MKTLFEKTSLIVIHQIKEMFEIVIDWETANKYNVHDDQGNKIGFAAERTKGIFHRIVRNILRRHRPLTIDIWDKNKKHVLIGQRNFYFFFSDLVIKDENERRIGEIKTRFGIIKRKYDLLGAGGNVFARIESPRWRLWTFTIFNKQNKKAGVISKKWGGILKEVFTDSDKFVIDLSKNDWNDHQKAVLLFASLCIDLDFFEDNSSSVLDLVD